MPKIAEVSEKELTQLMNTDTYQLWKNIKKIVTDYYELNQH